MKFLLKTIILLSCINLQAHASIKNHFENKLKDYDNKKINIQDIMKLSTKSISYLTRNKMASEKKSELVKFMLDELKERNIPLSIITYNVAISAYAAAKNSDGVFDLFFEMQSEDIEPDLITYVHVIPEYYKIKDLQEVMILVDRALREGLFNGSIQNGRLNLDINSVYPEGHSIRSIDQKNYSYLLFAILLFNETNHGLFNLFIEISENENVNLVEDFLKNHRYLFQRKGKVIRTFGPIQWVPFYPRMVHLSFCSPADF